MPDDKEPSSTPQVASLNDGLAEAMASIPAETPEADAPEPDEERSPGPPVQAEDGQPRDEHGRFAPNPSRTPQGDEPSDAKQPEERDGGQIPPWRLREMREERDRVTARAEAAERRAWELEQQQQALVRQQQEAYQAQQAQYQPPDPINDPQGYHQYWQAVREQDRQEWREQEINRWVQWSFTMVKKENPQLFEKAYETLTTEGRGEPARMVRHSADPGQALMGWYSRHVAEKEIGGDFEGYQRKYRSQLMDDPEFRKEAVARWNEQARGNSGNGQPSGSNVSSLPSLNRAPGGGSRQTPGDLGGSDREIFDNLNRKRER